MMPINWFPIWSSFKRCFLRFPWLCLFVYVSWALVWYGGLCLREYFLRVYMSKETLWITVKLFLNPSLPVHWQLNTALACKRPVRGGWQLWVTLTRSGQCNSRADRLDFGKGHGAPAPLAVPSPRVFFQWWLFAEAVYRAAWIPTRDAGKEGVVGL